MIIYAMAMTSGTGHDSWYFWYYDSSVIGTLLRYANLDVWAPPTVQRSGTETRLLNVLYFPN